MIEPIRFSALKAMAQSPAHYRYLVEDGGRRETGAMRKGTALHSYLLGGRDVVVYDGGVRRGAAWDEFRAANAHATILIPSEAAAVLGMRRAIEAHPEARRLLEGERERRIEWTIGGLPCAGTPDVVDYGVGGALVELKSARSSRPEKFVRDAQWNGYHAQLAWYLDGVAASGREPPRRAAIVAVESNPPYPVTVFELTATAIEIGRRLWRGWLERLLVCQESNTWPGYTDAIVPFDVEDHDESIVIDGDEVSLADFA